MVDHAQQHEDCWGMGSTLAMLLHFGDQVVSLHIGDSRVYRFSRKGAQLWRSTDHSLVQELIDAKVITEEQAATHPRRNVITRVFQAKESHTASMSVHVFDKIDEGDLFLICTVGVTEAWNDVALGMLVAAHEQDFDKLSEELAQRCMELSSDNNTFILAEWAQAYAQAVPVLFEDGYSDTEESITDDPMIKGSKKLDSLNDLPKQKRSTAWIWLILLLAACVSASLVYMGRSESDSKQGLPPISTVQDTAATQGRPKTSRAPSRRVKESPINAKDQLASDDMESEAITPSPQDTNPGISDSTSVKTNGSGESADLE